MSDLENVSKERLEELERLSVHWKLDVLWKSAMVRGRPALIHIDPHSRRLLFNDTEVLSRGDLVLVDASTATWRDLPFLIVVASMPRFPIGDGPVPPPSGPLLLSIELRDRDTDRTYYVNWPSNPKGYR